MPARSPIRVLITVPQLKSTASPYRQVIGLSRYLPKTEFNLTICSLYAPDSDVDSELRDCGVGWFKAPFRPKGRTLRHFWTSVRMQSYIDKQGPFDIQHSFDYTSWPFEPIAAKFRRVFFVCHQKNLNHEGKDLFLRLRLRLSDRIIAVSDVVEDFALRHGGTSRKTRRVYNGLDLSTIDYGLKRCNESPTILAVGHIGPDRRYEDAIYALSLLSVEMPTAQLKIIGDVFDKSYLGQLHHLVDNLNLGSRIAFLGRRKDVLEQMRCSNALVMCSSTAALSWATLEAMAVGLPVVNSAIEGPLEIVENGISGLLVPVGDVQGYAQALREILSDRELANKLAQNARRRVEEQFSVEKMVAGIAEVYRELV